MEARRPLSGSTFGILGDSYSTFRGCITEGNGCYYPHPCVDDVQKVEDTWWHILMQRNAMRLLVNDSYSGATVCNHVREEQPLAAAFTERAKRSFSGGDRLDYIIVFGGTNDSWLERIPGQLQYGAWSEEDLKKVLPAYCFVLDHISKKNPDTVILSVINTDLRPEIGDGFAAAGEHYGAVTVKLSQIDKQNGHPTALGMRQIADQIEATLR